MKIVIHGLGRVGATLSYTVLLKGLASELVLLDRDEKRAAGEALDLRHTSGLSSRLTQVTSSSDPGAAQGADIVALCASVPTPRDMTNRNVLADGNARLFAGLMPELAAAAPDAVFVVVSNPVDPLTRLCAEWGDLPAKRVLGSGTLVDSLRFRELLSEDVGIHPDDIQAFIIGEHGESQLACFNSILAGGQTFDHTPRLDKLFATSKRAGFDVFGLKGYTNTAVASAAAYILEAIALDTRRVMPVSTDVEAAYGAPHDICLSLPAVIGRTGVQRVLHPNLRVDELANWHRSADSVATTTARMRTAAKSPPDSHVSVSSSSE